MRHINPAGNQHTLEFDSWHEFVAYADKTPSDLRPNQRESRTGRYQTQPEYHHIVKYWGGYSSFKEAVKQSTGGWMEGAAEIAKTFSDFRIPQKRTQTEMAFSPVGPGTIAMGRYIQGHPEAMMVQRDTSTMTDQIAFNGGVAHLGVNISQSGAMSATARFQMGTLLLSLIDVLERNGKRVELSLFNAVTGMRGANIRIAVKVKKADSAVNMATLAAAFGNAGTQRRLCFSIRETLDADTRSCVDVRRTGGYGTTDPSWHTEGCTFIQGLGQVRFNDRQARIDWLKEQLAQQGIEWDGE